MDFTGSAFPLSTEGLNEACDLLTVGPAAIWTVLAVETHGCGFLPDRRPLILFERHIFHRNTGGIHSITDPQISSSKPGGYLGGMAEYDRLQRAIALDRTAALDSASWGIGQVMGFNAGLAGFESAEAMVTSMVQTEDSQLRAMVNFLKARDLDRALMRSDWVAFARGYNGKDFAKNHYDARLAASFGKFSTGELPDLTVRQVQVLLTFLGMHPGTIDGVIGKRTRSAIAEFRDQAGLDGPDDIDDHLISALRSRLQLLSRAAGVRG
jgi:hypothetical protein